MKPPSSQHPAKDQAPDRPPTPEPFVLVIFGATGDLTSRKLIPAVFGLFRRGLLPDDFSVVGFARRDKNDEVFQNELRDVLRRHYPDDFEEQAWSRFAARLQYYRSPFEDPAGFSSLRQRLTRDGAPVNSLFYLAVQPASISAVIDQLRDSGLARRGAARRPWARVIVEKPFGRDIASSAALNAELRSAFDENQVFRIDHYLGKETVQNILVLRFANSILEPIWNQKYIDHVQIAVTETIGIEGRANYYEQAGALRDIVQNHIVHLLCLTAMEVPGSLEPDAVRDEKVKVLRALRPIPPECIANGVIRAQYTAGKVHGENVPGYREEQGVAPESSTETFVAFRAMIDNWRWAGVPFYIRTGKRLASRITEISVHFRPVPPVLFNRGGQGPLGAGPMKPNVLAIRIQPNEGISLRFQVKVPGTALKIEPARMDFSYSAAFRKSPPGAYERLILDAAVGDPTLFTRGDEVEAAWAFVEPVIAGCGAMPVTRLPTYPAGSWGPKEADDLIQADGRSWTILRRPRPG